MKKHLVIIISSLCLFTLGLSAKRSFTLQQWLTENQKWAKKDGYKYNEEKVTARFHQIDADSDGIVTHEERETWKANKPKSGDKKNATPASSSAAKKKNSGGKTFTMEQWVKRNQQWAENDGWKFNQARAEEGFRKRDVNQDGLVTKLEIDYWNTINGKTKGEEKIVAWTLDTWNEQAKLIAEKRDRQFDPKVAEIQFNLMDTNGDRLLLMEEINAYKQQAAGQ